MRQENQQNLGSQRIELDLDRDAKIPKRESLPLPQAEYRRVQNPPIVSPETDRIGSDTARKTAGGIYLLQAALFGLLCFSAEVQKDEGQVLCAAVATFFLIIGLSLIRSSGFIEKIILWISYLRIGINSILVLLALAKPGKALMSSSVSLVSSIGLIVLLSGKSLSKPVFFIASAVVLITSFIYL